jgi:hypothetical protein
LELLTTRSWISTPFSGKNSSPTAARFLPKKIPDPDMGKRNCIRNIHPCTPSLSRCPPFTRLLSPTSLSHIGSKWREIALSTPVLWRAIPLGVPVERQAHIFDLWLKRSGSCPLTIGNDEEDNAQDSTELVASFMPYRARWEYLKIITSTSHLSALDSFGCGGYSLGQNCGRASI